MLALNRSGFIFATDLST